MQVGKNSLLGDGRKQNATITSCSTKAIVPQTIHEKTESQVPKRAQARLSARFQTPANELLIGCPGYKPSLSPGANIATISSLTQVN